MRWLLVVGLDGAFRLVSAIILPLNHYFVLKR